jgi:ribosomal protein S12 methylthiotransferase accessory factor
MQPIRVTFPGRKQVDAHCGGFVIHTDQPAELGGDGLAPAPFTVFLASFAACAGYYVLAFCQARNISMDGVHVSLEPFDAPAGRLARVRVHIDLPTSFPVKYIDSVRRAAESCKVKATLAEPPLVEVTSSIRVSDAKEENDGNQGATCKS